MTPQKLQKQLKLTENDPLWVCRNIGEYGRIILVEYGPWGTPGTQVMTIFGFYVSPQISNIEKF